MGEAVMNRRVTFSDTVTGPEPGVVHHYRWAIVLREALTAGFEPSRRNVLHWLSWTLALGLELALLLILREGVIYAWEQDLTRWIQQLPGKYQLFVVMDFLTNTLSVPFAILFTIIVLAVFRSGYRINASLLLLTFPLHVLAQFPKALIDRPRPSAAFPGIDGVGGFRSFPSGHAEFVITFYGFLTFLAVQRLQRRWQQTAVVVGWLILALATGLGRIATGRHWPIDITASYLIGAGILSGLIWLQWSVLQGIVRSRNTGRARSEPGPRASNGTPGPGDDRYRSSLPVDHIPRVRTSAAGRARSGSAHQPP
jgi:membrane-associated phospholipid phosphatase